MRVVCIKDVKDCFTVGKIYECYEELNWRGEIEIKTIDDEKRPHTIDSQPREDHDERDWFDWHFEVIKEDE